MKGKRNERRDQGVRDRGESGRESRRREGKKSRRKGELVRGKRGGERLVRKMENRSRGQR